MRSRSRRPAAAARRRRRRRLAVALAAYNLGLLAGLPAAVLWLAWRTVVGRRRIGSWRHRFGLVPRLAERAALRIWVHAVSAGEVAAARPVVSALRRQFPQAAILVSTHTEAGMAVARRSCPGADVFAYLPFDMPGSIGAALSRVRPALLVVVEKELWPNLLGLASLLGTRVLVVNGRVSDRMAARARWAGGLVRWLYGLPDLLCVQSREDADRLRALGVPGGAVVVAGNTKVDSLAQPDHAAEARLQEALPVGEGEHWLVAGSTHPVEEEAVVAAFRRIREAAASARLLLAPRHLERVEEVCAMVAARGMEAGRRSELPAGREAPVLVLDTMGELRAAYSFAVAGFVGGTLVPIGGHNLLEPVAAGRPVLFGPHTENCPDVADLVLNEGVGHRVSGPEELAERFLHIAGDTGLQGQVSGRARALVERERGASDRCAVLARELLREWREQ